MARADLEAFVLEAHRVPHELGGTVLAKVNHRRHTVTARTGGVEPHRVVVPQCGTVDRDETAVDGAEVELLAEDLAGDDEQDATLDGDGGVDPGVVAEIRQRHG